MRNSNIIHISLNNKQTKTSPVYQWDTGVVLHFDDAEIPLNTNCQFKAGDTTINQLVTDNECDVPNSILGEDFDGDIIAYLYMSDTDYGMTVYEIKIPVAPRNEPADHVSPDNTQTIEEWITEQVQLVEADKEEIENMTATASVDANVGTPAVVVTKTTVSDHVNLDFAFANLKGVKGDTGSKGDSIGTVSASVDANVGTPSVVVTQSGGSGSPIDVSMAFHNMKGNKGDKGNTGDSIGTVSASVDANVGTPSVTVTQSGGSGSPVDVSMAFHNLKGTKGDTGSKGDSIGTVTASVDSNVGTPSVTVTQSGGSGSPIDVDLAFHNMKGVKGNTGDSIGTVSATVDANTGTPAVVVTQSGGSGSPVNVSMAFSNLKGSKGDTGASGDSIGTVSASIDNNTGTPSVVVSQSGGSGSPIDVSLAFHNLKGVSFDTSYLPSDSASGSPATFPDGAKNVNVDSLVADINPVQTGSGTPSPSNPRPITGWSSIDLTHNGTTDTISLGQTVYGGSLNVTTGVLTIDKVQVDMGDLSWGYNTSYDYPYFGTSIPDDNIVYTEGELTIACEIYEALEGRKGGTFRTTDNDGKITTISNGGVNNRVALQDSLVTSVPDLKAKVGGYKLIYTLATPTTVQLTPVQVATVLGANSMQANSGDVAVSYRADIGLYIDKKLA